jgi:hypothetical protein
MNLRLKRMNALVLPTRPTVETFTAVRKKAHGRPVTRFEGFNFIPNLNHRSRDFVASGKRVVFDNPLEQPLFKGTDRAGVDFKKNLTALRMFKLKLGNLNGFFRSQDIYFIVSHLCYLIEYLSKTYDSQGGIFGDRNLTKNMQN